MPSEQSAQSAKSALGVLVSPFVTRHGPTSTARPEVVLIVARESACDASSGYRRVLSSHTRRGESNTDSCTASATARRNGPIFWLSRVGFTRFVSSTTSSSFSGSAQIEVPVKPVCPKRPQREDSDPRWNWTTACPSLTRDSHPIADAPSSAPPSPA